MLVQSKLFLLLITLHAALAWLAPERCKQSDYHKQIKLGSVSTHADVYSEIDDVASKQNKRLNETYSQTKFYGVPTSGHYGSNPGGDSDAGLDYEIYAPNKCMFYTDNSNALASVYCAEGVDCKLEHTVSTTSEYSAFEGYEWGVTASTKLNFFDIFEVGGEASTGGSYSCTYTHSRTTSDTVECSVSNAGGKTLQLYVVKSDMECQFSTVTMKAEFRNGHPDRITPNNYFSDDEYNMLKDGAIINVNSYNGVRLLPNLDRVSDQLLKKLVDSLPEYNPYTDLIELRVNEHSIGVRYYKEGSVEPGPRKVIPFTNKNGDSVYQYACVLT